MAMFPRGAVFTVRVLTQQKDGVAWSPLLGFLLTVRLGFRLAMFPRGAVFSFRVLAKQKDGVEGSSLLGFLLRKTDCSAPSV